MSQTAREREKARASVVTLELSRAPLVQTIFEAQGAIQKASSEFSWRKSDASPQQPCLSVLEKAMSRC
jgi:hypothetical protein